MQYNGNEIYATRYMKSLFLFGQRWIGYFRLYLTGVRYFCMRSMVSVSLPPCLRYALHMFTAMVYLSSRKLVSSLQRIR
ncbi:hypothetical protein DWW62_08215 [Clostridium sp. AF16-25]|nr:hypothetical protein DWW62_08215 [Clostridium sp. AF16-25]HBW55619.1 hypothetical protein [Lachnospiraceae bacterium]